MSFEDEIILIESMFFPEEFNVDHERREIQVEVKGDSSSLLLTVSFPQEYPDVSAKPRLTRMRTALNEVSLLRSLEMKAKEDALEKTLSLLNMVDICKDALLTSRNPCSICLDTVTACETITLPACQHSFHSNPCLYRFVWELVNSFVVSNEEAETRSKQTQKKQELKSELKSALDAQSALIAKRDVSERFVSDMARKIDEVSILEEGKKSNARHSKRYEGGANLDITEQQRQHSVALASLKTIEETIIREYPLLESRIAKAKEALECSTSEDLNQTDSIMSLESHLKACSKKSDLLNCPECRVMFSYSSIGKFYEQWLHQNHAALVRKTGELDLISPSSTAFFDMDDSTRKYLEMFKVSFSKDLNRIKAKGGLINDLSLT